MQLLDTKYTQTPLFAGFKNSTRTVYAVHYSLFQKEHKLLTRSSHQTHLFISSCLHSAQDILKQVVYRLFPFLLYPVPYL